MYEGNKKSMFGNPSTRRWSREGLGSRTGKRGRGSQGKADASQKAFSHDSVARRDPLFNPEVTPERLEKLLSLILGKQVKIKTVLPNDSVRLGAESSLLYTDIIVELEDRSLSNVEVQKIGYAFPGQRSACYSADHLLRQYKRVRGEQGKSFHYRNIKNVYTIVFFEQSPEEFHQFPRQWLHVFRQKSDTGLCLELLQEYYFIPLDIFRETMENKRIEKEEEAWLSFLSFDEPERIEELIGSYPEFRAMYQDIYEVCRNMEKVMNMYSRELMERITEEISLEIQNGVVQFPGCFFVLY